MVNAFGIIESGGLRVFDKILRDISIEAQYQYHIFCNNNEGVLNCKNKYDKRIVKSQHDLKEKYSNITEIFNKIS